MKKVLIISFFIFTILLSFFSTSYATVAVTGDKIFDFFKKLESSNLTIKQVGEGVSSNATISFDEMKITHENNKILFTAPDEVGSNFNFELNYTITDNKVSFSSARTYNVDDVENTEEAMNEVFVIMLIKYTSSCAFLSIADIQGTDLSIPYAYFSEKLKSTNEEGNKKEITDDVFYYSEASTDNSFSYNLEINLDNWSKVNSADSAGYAVTFTPITSSSTNKNDENVTDPIESGKSITERNWVDTIKLSELTQNEIYKYTANSTIQFPKIENDIGKNCLLYIKGRLDNNYKSEIYMSKKISGSSLSISFDEYSSGESFKIMYKELSNEELLKLVNKEEIIYLSNYKDGDKLEYQFEKYIYNDTEKNITIDTQDTAFGAEKTNTTTIEKGAIYGFNWMIDSATISYSKNISPNNNNANTNTGNISNSDTLQESVNKVTSSTSKLPQTGNFLNSQGLLILLIVICSIGLISNLKYKNINTK